MVMSLFAINTVFYAFYLLDLLILKGRAVHPFAGLGRSILFFYFLTFTILVTFMAVFNQIIGDREVTKVEISVILAVMVALYAALGTIFGIKRIVIKI
jgi:hypothetical protein